MNYYVTVSSKDGRRTCHLLNQDYNVLVSGYTGVFTKPVKQLTSEDTIVEYTVHKGFTYWEVEKIT